MNQHSTALTLVCVIGVLVSSVLAGAVLHAKRQALLQTHTRFHSALPGAAKWEGDWEFSGLGADPSQAGTERVTIPFVGTDLALKVRRGRYRGTFFVTVDGKPANSLPQEEHGAYLVLTSPDYAAQVVTIPVATGLHDGPHVAVVTADRGWDQWPLVGWSVRRGPDTTGYSWALAGLVAVGLSCLGGAVWLSAQASAAKIWEKISAQECASLPETVSFSALFAPLASLAGRSRPDDAPAVAASLVAAGALYFSSWLPLTVVAGLTLAVLILLRLDLGLALVALSAPFYLHPRSLPFGKAFSIVEIATLLCAASWAVRQIGSRCAWRGEQQEVGDRTRPASLILAPGSSLDLAAVFFVLASVASVFAAKYGHVALRELRVLILEPALFYLMLRTSRLAEKSIWRVVDFFVVGAVAVALIGLVQYALGINLITAEEGIRRVRSVYGSPNSVGLYLGRALPILAAVALFTGSRRRVAYGLAVVPIGLAMLLSFSRGAILLGVPLSLLAMGMLAGGSWLWASLGAAAVAAGGVIPLLRTRRFASLLDLHSGTAFFRLQLWRASWMIFRDHPWLGVGPDNFLYHYRSRYMLPTAWQEPDISQAHNILLDYATRLGIAGLAAGVWLQVAFWRLSLPLCRLTDPERRALALGLMGSMVNLLAHGLVDASYFLVDLAFAFFLTLGLMQWLARSEADEFAA